MRYAVINKRNEIITVEDFKPDGTYKRLKDFKDRLRRIAKENEAEVYILMEMFKEDTLW